ncbi:MAG: sigma-70 family RNA polymerase sigma factor [Ruminococcus sp.]|nr:sigma-70 family RNA polymerase sigma factor [Ruminococcus sp.]MDE7226510.1 sigma-70 family RNA polymerase sigma factor [Ruminococcus sp.]
MADDIKSYYEEYGRKVYLYLMSLCSDADAAEELTQETFYQAIRSLSKYRGDCSVYTWLCGIAKNLWFRELRRRNKNPIAEPDYSEADLSPPPDKTAESNDSKMFLLKQIHELPETEKEIVLLRATGELSFREIGEIFGKSENWARVTFYRTKQKLKKE